MKMKLSGIRSLIRKKRRSTLGRCVLFGLAMLLLTLIMSGIVTNSSQRALQNEIFARNRAQANAAVEQLAISIDKIMDMQRELLYDTDINRLGVAPGYYTKSRETFAMLRVKDRMFMLASSSPLITRAFFMAPSIGKTITSDGVDHLSSEEYAQWNDLCVHQTHALIEKDNRFYLMMAYPTYNGYLKLYGASYILSLELDPQAIAAFLSAHSTMNDEAMFLFNSDGKTIVSVNAEKIQYDINRLFESAREQSIFHIVGEDKNHYLVCSAANTTSAKTMILVKMQSHGKAFLVSNQQGFLFLALALILVIANLGYMAYEWHVIHKPLGKLADAFEQVEQGNLAIRIHHKRDDDFADMYHRFNHMNRKLENLIEQVYMQTIRTQRAELKQLQSQINPHFLYNTFFMIRSLAQLGDTDTIDVLSTQLGEYCQYVTRLGKQEVSLREEIAHARNYALIQDRRFSPRIRLAFPELPAALEQVVVPRLILQPLLENAYQHGLKDIVSNGLIKIEYRIENRDVLILVEDNGPALKDEELERLTEKLDNPDTEETTGLVNIHRRLNLRFGAAYGLFLARGEAGGLCVTMRIPL